MIVYLARAIQAFVMYCVNGTSRSSLLIESTDSMIKQTNLFACLSGTAGHALYGMAPCFGHTGVTFDAENDRPGPAASEVILRPPEAIFLTLKALF